VNGSMPATGADSDAHSPQQRLAVHPGAPALINPEQERSDRNRSQPAIDRPQGVQMRRHHHRITATIALTFALAATTATTASARLVIGDSPFSPPATWSAPSCGELCSVYRHGPVNMTTPSPSTAASCGGLCSHRHGPVNVATPSPAAPEPAIRIVRASPGGGFDWGDAGIGAGGGAGITLLAGALAAAGSRRRTRRRTGSFAPASGR
jgi:hypothetical protein